MCVCVCVCACACACVRVCVCVRVGVCVRASVCLSVIYSDVMCIMFGFDSDYLFVKLLSIYILLLMLASPGYIFFYN